MTRGVRAFRDPAAGPGAAAKGERRGRPTAAPTGGTPEAPPRSVLQGTKASGGLRHPSRGENELSD